jgi:hypothetical protein
MAEAFESIYQQVMGKPSTWLSAGEPQPSACEHNPQVSNVCPGRARDNRIIQRLEKSISVALIQKTTRVQVKLPGALKGRFITDSARRRAIAVNAIRPGAKRDRMREPARLSTERV